MFTRAYFVKPDWSLTPKGEVERTGRFALPFAQGCKGCRPAGNLSHLSYPWIDPKVVCSPKQLRAIAATRGLEVAVSWDQWLCMTKPFRDALAPEWPLSPCSRFGFFSGKVFGIIDDVVLGQGYNFLAKSSVCSRMIADGFEFLHFPADLKGRKPLKEPYVEVWVPPIAKPVDLKPTDYCTECSRARNLIGDSIVLPSAYANAPAFSGRHHSVNMFLSESFLEWVRKHGITGVNVRPEPVRVTWE